MDRLFVARALLTLATMGYSLLTVKADFNKTHATNPLWTGHARFHVVWQITSYVGLGGIALALIWAPGELAAERLYLVSAFAAVVYSAFFIALFSMPIYGGRAYDENGYLPIAVSADNITASAPSRMALATSETSARVGRELLIMLSNISVATMEIRPITFTLWSAFF